MDEKQSLDGSLSERDGDGTVAPVIKSSPAVLPNLPNLQNLQQLRQVTDIVALAERSLADGPRPRFELTSLVRALPEPVRPPAPPGVTPIEPLPVVPLVEPGLIAPAATEASVAAADNVQSADVENNSAPALSAPSLTPPPVEPAAAPPPIKITEPALAPAARTLTPLAERLSTVSAEVVPVDPTPNPEPVAVARWRGQPPAAPGPTPPAKAPQQPDPPRPVPRSLLYRGLRFVADVVRFGVIAFIAWFVTVMVLIAAFRFIDPPQSMLMLTKRLSGQTLQHQWVPLERVANSLRRAVITSEDGKFCRHWGFDLGEIRAAIKASDGGARGASTITQQLAKNLFLWPGKSYLRKALEVPLTLAMEGMWPKRRILEVYLNVAEWGPGVFGAEAAAQYYYNKPASALSDREAALLSVSLPNPIARDASDPDPAIARRASTLQARMRVQGISYCALTGSASRPQPR